MRAVPETRREDVVETLHGREVADPYRWLEGPCDEWIRQQHASAEGTLAGLPARDWFRGTLDEILARLRIGVPIHRAGRYVVERITGGQAQGALYVAEQADELVAGGRLVVDPLTLSPDGSTSVDNFSLSPDGQFLAYGTRTDGNPRLTFRVVDLTTHQHLDDVITDGKFWGVCWLPDSSFVYLQVPPDAQAISGSLKRHRLGTAQSDDQVILQGMGDSCLIEPAVSHDGRYIVAHLTEGTEQRNRLWLLPIAAPAEPIKLIDEAVAKTRFVRTAGDRLVLWTDLDAPFGRIVACSADDPSFDELVPERDSPVIAAKAAGYGVLLVSLVDVQPVVELVALDGTRSQLDVTGGALVGIDASADCSEAFIGLSSTSTPNDLVHIDVAGTTVRRLTDIAGTRHRVVRRTAHGRQVPYFLISRADLEHSSPRPTLLYGYGGFRVPQLADYRPGWDAWIEAGGVLVIANVRGGGEFGAGWHDAGRLSRKQNSFDDFIGVAEHLLATGITTARQLAVHGHSGGGLLVGAVMTQRPELFAAALPSAGVMDMLRFHLFTIGRAWAPEIGLPEDKAQFEDLLAYSPLHNLRDGTSYPATLVMTSDHDEVVVPMHSYKFAATLQHVQAADKPVLLRVQTKTGHGPGRARAAIASEWADLLAFAAFHTGLDPRQG
jgi:prolyl oligopeptidase